MSALCILLSLTIASPDSAQPSLERAEALLSHGDLAGASLAFTDALAADPENVDVLQAAALVALQEGEPQRAVEYLAKVLELDPNNDDAKLDLARAQYLAGDASKSEDTLAAVLERHPRFVQALTLDKEIRTGTIAAPPRPSPWRTQGRAGIAAVYDSNLSLDPGLVPDVSNRRAALMNVEAAATVGYTTGPLPMTLFAQLADTHPLKNSHDLSDLAPTTVRSGFIASHSFGDLAAGLDARYEELFTDDFGKHMQRLLSPSLFGSYRVAGQDLRLLGGIEWRQPFGVMGTDSNLTYKIMLRDTTRLGRLTLVADLSGRANTAAKKDDEPAATSGTNPGLGSRDNFGELAGVACAEYALLDTLAAVLMLDAEARRFDSGTKESTYAIMAGGRHTFSSIEVHAEYGFTKNLSDAQHSYDRHQLTAGVRAYWE